MTRFIAVAVAGIALTLGIGLLLAAVVFVCLPYRSLDSTELFDPAVVRGVFGGGCFLVAVLTLGPSVAFFYCQSAAGRSRAVVPVSAVLFAGLALLFGFFAVVMMVGGLLEGLFVEVLPALGKFPDPEMSPWACLLAVVTWGPSLAFFSSQLSTRRRHPLVPALASILALLFGLLMLGVAMVGLMAVISPDLLPGLERVPALAMSAGAITLAVLLRPSNFRPRVREADGGGWVVNGDRHKQRHNSSTRA